MRSDPSDNGGLFVGRRPGTAPVHFRALPERGSAKRQRIDGWIAAFMQAAIVLLSLLCWGPIPIACLWVGSQVNYLTGSVSLGILGAVFSLSLLLFGALSICAALTAPGSSCAAPPATISAAAPSGTSSPSPPPSAAGYLPSGGSSFTAPGPAASQTTASKPEPMGLLDYYRQFEALTEEEVNIDLREEAAERRRKALTRVVTLDLSQTTWPELPHPNVVNAITFTARAGLHRYPHTRGAALRKELAERHGVPAERLIVGDGAGQLLTAATRALIAPGQELLTTWPSYPLFPIMARRAHGQAVPVKGGIDELLAAVPKHNTRVVALASPNDPTGELLPVAELKRLLAGLPDGVGVLLMSASSSLPTRSRPMPHSHCLRAIHS